MKFLNGKIAIVGNGPGEIGRAKGAEIDSNDFVFRFNNYKIVGFEVDYGTKTTHWITSFWYDIRPRDLSKYQKTFCTRPIMTPEFITSYHVQKYFSAHNIFYAAKNRDFIDFMPIDLFASLFEICEWPSTGLSLIYWLKHARGLHDVTLYGFDFFDQKNQSKHYFDRQSKVTHETALEKKLVTDWLNE